MGESPVGRHSACLVPDLVKAVVRQKGKCVGAPILITVSYNLLNSSVVSGGSSVLTNPGSPDLDGLTARYSRETFGSLGCTRYFSPVVRCPCVERLQRSEFPCAKNRRVRISAVSAEDSPGDLLFALRASSNKESITDLRRLAKQLVNDSYCCGLDGTDTEHSE